MTQIQNKAGPAGGIAGSSQAQGLIANCYSANNIIKNRESYNGGICGKASDGAHIENCYVYNIDLITTKGLFAGIAANSFFIHNYYDNAKITFIGKMTMVISCLKMPNTQVLL